MKDIYQVLGKLGIKYKKYDHPPVFTAEEASKFYHLIPGAQCKNLFLRNKNGNTHYMVIIPDAKKADLKMLAKQLQESKLSFASPERMMKYLSLTPGSVSPFGLINNEEKNVIVIIDKWLTEQPIINFHPNINTATLGLSQEDFQKFLGWCGNKLTIFDL